MLVPLLAATAVTVLAWRTGDWWDAGFAGREQNLTLARILIFLSVAAATWAAPVLWRRTTRLGRLAFAGWAAYLGVWLLGLWPGILMSDSVDVMTNSRAGMVYEWFSYLHAFLAIALLDVVPHVGFIVVVQVLLTAALLAYATSLLRERTARRWPIVVMTIVAALSAPIVVNTLLFSRDTSFAVLHVFLALWVARAVVDRGRLSRAGLVGIAALVGFLSVYRGDGIVLALVVPLVLLVGLRPSRKVAVRGATAFAAALVLFHVALPAVLAHKEENENAYALTLRLNPLGAVLNSDFHSRDRAADLAALGRVVNVDAVRRKHTPAEIPAYWEGDWNGAATDADFAAFETTADRLFRDNPGTVLASRAATFASASGLSRDGFTGADVPDAVADRTSWIADPRGMVATPPVLRLYTAQADLLQASSRYGGLEPWGRSLHWNLLPWLLLTVAVLLAFRRARFEAVVAVVILSRVPLVFLAAPAGQHKYYYSVHLAGVIVLGFLLARYRAQRRVASPPAGPPGRALADVA